MYIVRFVRADGKPNEDYICRTKEAAHLHFELFKKDDSRLYKSVSVYNDETNFIEDIIPFDKDGIPQDVISEGSVVRLKRAFCSEKEVGFIYAVSNINENLMRCNITCLNGGTSIPSTETVGIEMVYPVGTSVEDILTAAAENNN